jgi:CheY-like chemotaxis protein
MIRQALRGLMARDDFSLKAPGGFELSAKRREQAATALTEATGAKDSAPIGREEALGQVDDAARVVHELGISPRLLWVDDRPSNNRYERAALEALGLIIDLSVSTEDALERIHRGRPFDLIISDMGRPPDPRAGYTLLDKLRSSGDRTPYIIYAGSRSGEHFDEAVRRGAEGCTNRPQELIDMAMAVLRRQRAA